MQKHDFLTALAKKLDTPELNEEDELSSFANWDSMGQMGVLALLDAEFNVRLPAGKLADCRRVRDLWDLAIPSRNK